LGQDEAVAEFRNRRIGFVWQRHHLMADFTAAENVAMPLLMRGCPYDQALDAAGRWLGEVGLASRAQHRGAELSGGEQQRVAVARALVNDPAVVFLDEPTLGLDPRGQKELLDLILRIPKERNSSIVLCSHLLSEIEGVCDDVVILSSGQVVAKGTVADVIGGAQRNVIRIHVPASSVARAQELLQAAQGVSKVTQTSQAGWLRVDLVDPGDATQDHRLTNGILESLIRADVPIQGFEAQGGRLQEAFLHLTERVAR
jgi:ABC-2 type transport system ATP-binding protein